jgi:hypothetical protein
LLQEPARAVVVQIRGDPELGLFDSRVDEKRPTHLDAGMGSWPAAVEAAGMSRHAKRKSSKLKQPKTKLGLPSKLSRKSSSS